MGNLPPGQKQVACQKKSTKQDFKNEERVNRTGKQFALKLKKVSITVCEPGNRHF
jgi:hypothetical protein